MRSEKYNRCSVSTSKIGERAINDTAIRLIRECLGKFGDALGREVWEAINSVFDVLPLAAVIDDQVSLGFDEILVEKMIS